VTITNDNKYKQWAIVIALIYWRYEPWKHIWWIVHIYRISNDIMQRYTIYLKCL